MFKKIVLIATLALPLLAHAGGAFTLSSPDIQSGKRMADTFVFNSFGCTGQNLSPALAWKNAPKGTKSFAVTAYDPDAPTGSGWWHWVVYNLPAETRSLPQGAGDITGAHLPEGSVQGRTDFGSASYGGPCPPVGHGTHHYTFTVYALKTDKLELPTDASAAMVGFMIHANTLGKARFTAVYSR